MSTDGSSQHSHKNNFLLRMSANVDGYSMCNEKEVEVIRETLLEANSLLDDGTVIPDTFLRDATFGQKPQQESQKTIGTVIPKSIPAVHGSPRRELLNDAQRESLTMEQQ
jgi:hypothetical protein